MSHSAIDIDTDELQLLSDDDFDVYYPGEEQHVDKKVIRFAVTPPDKKVIRFAVIVAVLEKLATASSSLAFIWSTVVLLGGFATALDPIDFWMVTGILSVEGMRILSRRNQIEWHQSISLEDHELKAAIYADSERDPEPSETLGRTGVLSVLEEPFQSSFRSVSTVLSVFQLLLAITCVALSTFRLSKHDYGSEVGKAKNGRSALMLFYVLALVEAGVFLGEKAYWFWMVTVKDIFNVASNELAFGSGWGSHVVKSFFYHVYGSSVDGSVFSAWKMDFVSFGLHLFSVSDIETPSFLVGVMILLSYVKWKFKKKENVVRRLEELMNKNNENVVRRLEELMKKKNSREEQYIRLCAVQIMSAICDDRERFLEMAWVLVGKSDDTSYVQNQGILVGIQILSQLAKDEKWVDRIIDEAKRDCQIAYGFQKYITSSEFCVTFIRHIVDQVARIPVTDRPPFPLVELVIDIIIEDGTLLYVIYYYEPHAQKHIQLLRRFLLSLVNPEWEYLWKHKQLLYSKVITALKKMASFLPTFFADLVREIGEGRLRIRSFNIIALILRNNNEEKIARHRVQPQQIYRTVLESSYLSVGVAVLQRLVRAEAERAEAERAEFIHDYYLESLAVLESSYLSLGEAVLQRLVRAEAIHDYHLANLASEVIEGLDSQQFQTLMDATENDPLELIHMIVPLLRQNNVPFNRPDTLLYVVKFIAAVAEKTDTCLFQKWSLREEILSTLLQIRHNLPPPPPDSSEKRQRYFVQVKAILDRAILLFSI